MLIGFVPVWNKIICFALKTEPIEKMLNLAMQTFLMFVLCLLHLHFDLNFLLGNRIFISLLENLIEPGSCLLVLQTEFVRKVNFASVPFSIIAVLKSRA